MILNSFTSSTYIHSILFFEISDSSVCYIHLSRHSFISVIIIGNIFSFVVSFLNTSNIIVLILRIRVSSIEILNAFSRVFISLFYLNIQQKAMLRYTLRLISSLYTYLLSKSNLLFVDFILLVSCFYFKIYLSEFF